ncbi:unnamed protein product, partial [Staurois parvus]
IHYIWSPTVHRPWNSNYFSKYKLLNTFFLLSVFSTALVKACRRSFHSPLHCLMRLPLTLWTVLIGPVLVTCTLPREKKTVAIHTKVSMCSLPPRLCFISRWIGDSR